MKYFRRIYEIIVKILNVFALFRKEFKPNTNERKAEKIEAKDKPIVKDDLSSIFTSQKKRKKVKK